MNKGLMDKPIEDLVFKEKKGFVSDAIRRPNSFLILKVDERFEAGQASYEEVKNELQERLTQPKMEGKVRTFLTSLREDAFLEIKEGYIDSGAAPGKDTRAGRNDKRMMQTEWRPESLKRAQEIKRHAESKGITAGQFAVAWVLNAEKPRQNAAPIRSSEGRITVG